MKIHTTFLPAFYISSLPLLTVLMLSGAHSPGQAQETAREKLSAATRVDPFRNSLGLEFVPVQGYPGIYMCRTETRVRDFRAFAEAENLIQQGGAYVINVSKSHEEGGYYSVNWALDKNASWQNPGFEQGDDHPVVCVNWGEARAFCAWLTKQEPGLTYRLPNDEEWSTAAGAEANKYPWGNDWPPPVNSGNYRGAETLGWYEPRGAMGMATQKFEATGDIKVPNGKTSMTQVTKVFERSSAEKAGIKVGDFVYEINGTAIEDHAQLREATASLEPGDQVEMKVMSQEGKTIEVRATLGNLAEMLYTAYSHGDGAEKTAPVGRYEANGLGILDLGGNISEWCEGEYRTSMNSQDTLEAYPELKNEKDRDGTPFRVVRGCSWSDETERNLRSSYRASVHPLVRVDGIGFRLVVTVDVGR